MFKEGGYVANVNSYSRGQPAIRFKAEFACTRPCVVSTRTSGRRAPLNDMHTPVNFYLIGQFNSAAFAARLSTLTLGYAYKILGIRILIDFAWSYSTIQDVYTDNSSITITRIYFTKLLQAQGEYKGR